MSNAPNTNKAKRVGCIIVLIIVAFVAFLTIRSCYTQVLDPNSDNAVMTDALSAIKENLKSPSTAKFTHTMDEVTIKDLGNNKYVVSSWVDSQNSFGATIRSDWSVTIIVTGNDTFSYGNVSITSR